MKQLLALLATVFLLVNCGTLYRKLGGDFAGEPSEMREALSPEAKTLIDEAFSGIEPERLTDFHIHVIGTGRSGSGIEVNPTWISYWHPILQARSFIYMSAAGITDLETADEQFVERLVNLTKAFPTGSKFFLYAMDRHYAPDGQYKPRLTSYYIPNEYVWRISKKHADLFIPVVSIHPYRLDAIEKLEQWARKGCRFVKWIPNAQGIDPSSRQIEPFYEAMRKSNMVLLSHTGAEDAVESHGLQHFGNPLLLRKPLDMGLKVVALHAGGRGSVRDLDAEGHPETTSFEMFLRLMGERKYKGLLLGEISAATFANRETFILRMLLERTDIHYRLVNGGDYPTSAINVVVQTKRFVREGLISAEQRDQLNEIYSYNPLLYEFVLKRTLRHPESGNRLPASVFMMPQSLH